MNKKIKEDVMTFHPGYYISEIIEDMDITQEEFAVRLGTTPKTISKLVNCETGISKDLAMKLSNMLNTSSDVWLNLQKQYDVQMIEKKRIEELSSQIEVVREIDYSFFVRNNLLPSTRDAIQKIQNLCSFLSISSLNILTEEQYNLSFRNGIKTLQKKNILSSNVWVETATKIGRKYDAEIFDEKKLREAVNGIVELTNKPLNETIDYIKEELLNCGVVLVMIPYLKNSGLHGFVKWFNKDKVLVAISDRRKYTDTFWFTFFHEIGHVFQRNIRDISYTWESDIIDELENDANEYAQNMLIPYEKYQMFIDRNKFTLSSVLAFSTEINRDPGIIVGRLQNDEKIKHSQHNKLKLKIPNECFLCK